MLHISPLSFSRTRANLRFAVRATALARLFDLTSLKLSISLIVKEARPRGESVGETIL